eukprot:Skav211700  [mRNA]  locus=scaffold1535:216228:218787:+ [translate_table: standard]
MSFCAKCRQVPPEPNDTWCLGCSGWEAIEKSLKTRWTGPPGLRRVAENLVASAAREVRALQGSSLGLTRPAEPVGPPPKTEVKEEQEDREENAPSAASKSKARDREEEEAASEYSYYEDESEDKEEQQGQTPPRDERAGVSAVLRGKQPPKEEEEDRERAPRARSSGRGDKRPRSKSLERRKPVHREQERKGKGKGQRRRRAGRKHKRYYRLAEDPYTRVHRGLSNAELSERPACSRPTDNIVVEFELEDPGLAEVRAAILVGELTQADDGGWLLRGKFLGSNSQEMGKALTSKMTRRRRPLHLCRNVPCSQGGDILDYVHSVRARWFAPEVFEELYITNAARASLKEAAEGKGAAEKETGKKPGAAPKRKRARPKDGEEKPSKVSRKKKGGEKEDKGGPPGKPDAGGPPRLRAKLAALRKRLAKAGGEAARVMGAGTIDVSDGSDLGEDMEKEPFDNSEEMDGMNAGDQLEDQGGRDGILAIEDGEVDPVKKEEDGPMRRKKKRKRLLKKKKDAASQLLAIAAQKRQREDARNAKKRKKKGKSGTAAKVTALVKALIGRGGGDKRKRGRKSRRKKPSGSPSPSGSGEESEEEKTSTDEEDLIAPLEKRSRRKPGAVLSMLLDHAREVMDQSSGVTTRSGPSVTQGVKMASYFNMMVRPYYPPTSRDMKEMHLLAVALDELRAGDLGKLGDSLASRFIAIHTAVNEGNWRAAQYLEMHRLEAPTGAPSAVLLEAQRHGRLVNKNRGWDEPRWNRWGDTRAKGTGKDSDWKGKGKGKTKGDAKNRPYGGKGGDQSRYWANNKDTKGAKDDKGKGAPKDGDS